MVSSSTSIGGLSSTEIHQKQLGASVTCQKIRGKALVLHCDPPDFFPVFKTQGDMLHVGGERTFTSLGQLISGKD